MMRPTADSIKHIAGALENTGYVVVPRFLADNACAALARECRVLQSAGTLRAAAVGRAGSRIERSQLRGDRMHWFDAAAPTPAQSRYWRAMDRLRVRLNRALLLGLDELEAHYALYAPGTHYARHRDRFRDDDARVLSSVLYLNPDWRSADGGALRLFLPASAQIPHVDIYPETGTLALFLSAEFDHEVLPAARERLSVAAWFRQRRDG